MTTEEITRVLEAAAVVEKTENCAFSREMCLQVVAALRCAAISVYELKRQLENERNKYPKLPPGVVLLEPKP